MKGRVAEIETESRRERKKRRLPSAGSLTKWPHGGGWARPKPGVQAHAAFRGKLAESQGKTET